MTARWFVKSRGRRADEGDYTWRGVSAADPAEADRITERGWRGRPCFSLVDDERDGLLLFDDQSDGTVLLITGLLPAEHPVDYRQRVIRVALLGVARHDDEEGKRSLVAVAVRALRDGLTADLPVSYGGTGGFAVVEQQWPAFIRQAVAALASTPGAHHDPGKPKLLPDTEEVRHWIADDLAALCDERGLPALGATIAVLRTNLIDTADWRRLRPWRTISGIATLTRQEADLRTDPLSDLADLVKNTVRDHLGWISGIIGLLAIAGVVVLVVPQGSAPHPQVRPPASTPGWRVTDVIGASGGASKLGSIVALGHDYALGIGSSCGSGCVNPAQGLLMVTWNGTGWRQVVSPEIPAGKPAGLAVGASSATNAWILESTQRHSYALHWDGKNISPQELPGKPDISAVAVTGPENAWAFGTAPDGSPDVLRLIADRWWPAALPAIPSPDPGAVSAPPGDGIWVAATTSSTARLRPVMQEHALLHWDGRSWQTIGLPAMPLPAGGYIGQIRLAAISSSNVWVAGLICTAAGPQKVFLLRWDGASWHSAAALRPVSGLGGLAQDGDGGLWLIGTPGDGTSYLYHYSGGRWTGQAVPRLSGRAVQLSALSWIPGTRAMWALGQLSSAPPGKNGSQAVILKYGR